jgi:hypothetical protein
MERKTIEVILPESGAKVLLFAYLVNGDYKLIQKKLSSTVKMRLGDDGKPLPGEADKMREIPMSLMLEEAEATQRVLVKEIVLSDGSPVMNVDEFIYNLSIADAKILDEKTDEISKASTLSSDAKKK